MKGTGWAIVFTFLLPVSTTAQTDSLSSHAQKDSSQAAPVQWLRSQIDSIGISQVASDRIITREELSRYYHEDAADWFYRELGIFIHDLGSYGRPITASSSGLSQRSLVVQLDGVPMNDPDAGWMNLNSISLDNLDRIEIRRTATNVIVNLVPRNFDPAMAVTTLRFRSVFDDFRDIGVYFGRNFGPRFQSWVGGGSRGTPGEQLAVGLQGGQLVNFNRSRYSGKNLFGGFRYAITPALLLEGYGQSFKDRYDAFGRDIDPDGGYQFTTPNALRKNERSDQRLALKYRTDGSVISATWQRTAIDRRSTDFRTIPVPSKYGVGSDHFRTGWTANLWDVSVFYRNDRLERAATVFPEFKTSGVMGTFQIPLGIFQIIPSGELRRHSVYGLLKNVSTELRIPVHGSNRVSLQAGYSEIEPSLIDEWNHSINALYPYYRNGSPSRDTLPGLDHLAVTRLLRASATAVWRNLLIFDEVTASLYANRFRHPIYWTPVNVGTDSEHVAPNTSASSSTYGIDLGLTRNLAWTRWTLNQTLLKGDRILRSGAPWYRASLTGFGERFFFQKNLRLTATLTVSYVQNQGSYTFRDTPETYFYTGVQHPGGFNFFTRVSGYIGTMQIYYEAENIFRDKRETLNGYSVTPQQWRFGFEWTLYN